MATDNGVCRLIVERNIYPATRWHWTVEIPDGHQYAVSKGDFGSLQECMEKACTGGVIALEHAERLWAGSHLDYALKTGMMMVEKGTKGTYDGEIAEEEEAGEREAGCLVAFACGAVAVIALMVWGIMGACGRWPALCSTMPVMGAIGMGFGAAMVWRAGRENGTKGTQGTNGMAGIGRGMN